MAVATPILERKIEDTHEEVREYASQQTADEIHNSLIRQRYAQLINPETKMSDIRPVAAPAEPVQEVASVQITAPVKEEIYLAESARTHEAIFNAESEINKKVTVIEPAVEETAALQQIVSDEENEDLMPSRTTMQYTSEAKKMDEEGTISNRGAEKRISLTKRDKIVIAVVVSVIVALFVLIIVNSAIISGVNNDLSSLQSSLDTARGAYNGITGQISDYEANFDEILKAFAESFGMFR